MNGFSHRKSLVLLLLWTSNPSTAFAEAPAKVTAPGSQLIEGLAQGTSYRIAYRGAEQPTLRAAVEARLAEIDKIFSNYRPDSEISRFNEDKSLKWFSVSPELITVVAYAETISKGSHGAYDITVAPLLKIWGFGPYKRTLKDLPSPQAIQEARKQVGYQKLAWRKQPPALRKTTETLLIDLSGIAQGYSVDAIALVLEAKGVKDYMVEIGGEVRTRGDKGVEGPWQILIESPSVEPDAEGLIVYLKNMSLTTSGDYRNFFEKEGKRYSHILDPRTGVPVQHELAAVSILARTALEADGWDTALLVLGPSEARALIKEKKLASYLVLHTGQDFVGEANLTFEKALKK